MSAGKKQQVPQQAVQKEPPMPDLAAGMDKFFAAYGLEDFIAPTPELKAGNTKAFEDMLSDIPKQLEALEAQIQAVQKAYNLPEETISLNPRDPRDADLLTEVEKLRVAADYWVEKARGGKDKASPEVLKSRSARNRDKWMDV